MRPTEEDLLQEAREEVEDHLDRMERERRYGPVWDDPDVEAELVDPKVRNRYREQEPFDA